MVSSVTGYKPTGFYLWEILNEQVKEAPPSTIRGIVAGKYSS
jgi:hypothetical protein